MVKLKMVTMLRDETHYLYGLELDKEISFPTAEHAFDWVDNARNNVAMEYDIVAWEIV